MAPIRMSLLVVMSRRVHRQQLVRIEYFQANNKLLKVRLKSRNLRSTVTERALSAGDSKAVGHGAAVLRDRL